MEKPMTFDSNRAWKEASAAVIANRDVLLALAGVFFLLPSLAFALLMPAPEAQPGATPQQAVAAMTAYYAAAAPFLIPMTIVQAAGTLGLLALFTDKRRPTVGEAIRLGFVGLLPYIGVQLLLGVALGLGFAVLGGIAAASGVQALVVIVIVGVVLGGGYVVVKTSLAAPIIVVEGVRNPVVALRRSWLLTKGNSVRLALFYLLLAVVSAIIVTIIMAVVGVLATLFAGGEPARVIAAILSSTLGSVMTLYFVAVIAAAHRQLAGPSADRVSETFL
jgi:hypothetical protein